MNGITAQEKQVLRNNKIVFKIIVENDFLLTMIGYVGSPLIYEMSFDARLYQDGRLFDISKSNLITVIGVDSSTNIIQTLRTVSTPLILFDMWQKYWFKSWDAKNYDADYSKKYKEWVDSLDAKYSVVALWQQAEYISKII